MSTLRKVPNQFSDNANTDKSRNFQLSTTAQLREQARKSLDAGAVTASYGADREMVIKLLNHALATELVCVLRYRHHYYVAEGLPAEAIKQEFLEHANEEQGHADQIAERIIQLGGDPNFDPTGLAERSHAEYGTAKSLVDILRDDLIAERVAIASYTELIRYIGDDDPTTKRMLEQILSKEEEHAEELASLLAHLDQWKNGSR
ncbi:MAG: ferritin-like domain-containing protein [Steroidobacteraceae bacterium]